MLLRNHRGRNPQQFSKKPSKKLKQEDKKDEQEKKKQERAAEVLICRISGTTKMSIQC